MANEVASGYINLIVKSEGLKKGVESELSGVQQSVNNGGQKSAFLFGGAFKKTIAGAGIGAALGAAATVKGGWDRALNLEDARGSLAGLGHDVKTVDRIMQNAYDSTLGTAYRADEAAGVAASAVAAGIKPGKELESVLSLMGDAAFIAGTDLGSMGAIFNKVASTDMVQGDVLAQLGDQGIPILQLLAEEMGVTASEVRDMASAGEIDFATFSAAMEGGMGGAAQQAGETTRGALANMMVAFSTIGQNIIESVMPYLKTFIAGVTEFAQGLQSQVGPAIAGVIEWFARWRGILIPLALTLGAFLVAYNGVVLVQKSIIWIRNAALAFKALGVAMAANPIGLIVAGIAVLVAGLIYAYNNVGWFKDAVDAAFKGIQQAVGVVVGWFMTYVLPVLQSVWAGIVSGAQWLWQVLQPVFAAGADLIAAVVERIKTNFGLFMAFLAPIFGWIASAWSVLWAGIQAAWAVVGPPLIAMVQVAFKNMQIVLTAVWSVIQTVIKTVMGVIQGIIQVVTGVISGDWSKVWQGIQTVASSIWAGIEGIIQTGINLVRSVISNVLSVIRGVWDSAWSGISSFVSGVWDNVVSAVSTGVGNVLGFIEDIPGKVQGALSDAGSWLVQVGRDIIGGLIDGVSGMIDSAVQSVKDVGGAMLDGVKGFLGIKSPSRVFANEVGLMMSEGIVMGLDKGQRGLDHRVQGMVNVPRAPRFEASGYGSDVASERNVYVQSPFTGDYLLARVADIAVTATGNKIQSAQDRLYWGGKNVGGLV